MTEQIAKENPIMAVSHAKNLRIAPNKIDKILKQIRGKKYSDALKLLKQFPQKPGASVWNTLYSAASNAKNNLSLSKEKLFVSEAYVNQGRILKRRRCRARGKTFKIEKKYCHLSIFLKEISQKDN